MTKPIEDDPFAPFPPTAQAVPPTSPRNPAQTGASYVDPWTGRVVSGGTRPPIGTPYYASAPLLYDAQGRAATATGDKANAFRDYVGPQGGSFGGFGLEYGPNANLMSRIANQDTTAYTEGLASEDPRVKAAAQSYSLGFGSQGLGNTLDNGGTFEGAKAYMSGGLVGAGMDYQTALKQGWVDPSGKSTGAYEALRAQAEAANQAAQPQAPQAPPQDADPFGQFDDPAHPTHGIITPQSEAGMGAQAMHLPPIGPESPAPAGPTLRPPMQPGPATDAGGYLPASGPVLTPPVLQPGAATDLGGMAPQPPDPFAPFQVANTLANQQNQQQKPQALPTP